MADLQTIQADPDFIASGPETKRKILTANDTDFAASSRETQDRILRGLSARYENPPTLGQQVMGGLRSAASEVLPTAGLLGGGLLGAAAGAVGTGPIGGVGAPVGAVVGAGLGYATGRQANRAVGAAADYFFPPQNQYVAPPQAGVGVIGQDVLAGGTMEMGGPVAARGLQAAGAALRAPMGIAGAPTAEDLAVRAAAGRQGIQLPAGAASASNPVSLIESIPGRFPLGRQATDPMVNRIQGQAQQAAERISADLGMPKTLEQAGQSVQAEIGSIARAQENAPTELVNRTLAEIGGTPQGKLALGGAVKEGGQVVEQARRQAASRIYDEAIAGRAAEDVPLPTLNRVATNMLEFEKRLQGVKSPVAGRAQGLAQASGAPPTTLPGDLPDAAVSELIASGKGADVAAGAPLDLRSLPSDFIQRYGLSEYGTRTFEETIAIQQRLRALARNATDDVSRRQVKTLLDAVTQDITAFAGPGTLADAATFYKNEVAVYFAKNAPLRRLLSRDPGALADQILSTKSPDLLKQMVETLPAAQRTDIQRALLERMKTRSLDLGTGEVDPAKFRASLSAFGQENLGIVFGSKKAGLDALDQTLATNFGQGTTDTGLAHLLNASPERIVNTLAKGKVKSLAEFDAVWTAVSPAAKQEMRSSLYNEVLANSFDNATGRFSIERFTRQKEMVPQPIWDRMLTDNPAAALRDVELTFRRLSQYSRGAANPSGTAQSILGPGQILGGAALAASTVMGREDPQSFTMRTFGLLSPLALGVLIASPAGQRMLTSRAVGAVNQFGGPATLMKMIGAQVNEARNPSDLGIPPGQP
jgi:hypothetical protein